MIKTKGYQLESRGHVWFNGRLLGGARGRREYDVILFHLKIFTKKGEDREDDKEVDPYDNE